MSSATHTSCSRVLRIRRSDEADAHVLLHVCRSNVAALELNITATEGENPYAATVRQSQLKRFRAKQYQGSDEEWKDIVLHILGLPEEAAGKSDLLSGIEVSAAVNGSEDDGKELILTVRKRIQDITQKLGSLTLNQDDEQAIELFEWSNIAVARAESLEENFEALLDRYRTAEDTINSLNKQLEELISLKNLHEQQLMSDFVQLLNEKKLKVRNQQRLLASAKVDTESLSTMRKAMATDRSKPGATVRGSKRAAAAISDGDSDSEDGFEKMDVDKSNKQGDFKADEETDNEERSTPQPLEDEDTTTTDDEASAASAEGSERGDIRRRGLPKRSLQASPPPRRELPFARRTQKAAAPAESSPPCGPGQTGRETDDDEL
ncbi:uncharacterized protein BJX67DRAFT_384611 [Aspergillus lucknowensis]|uniref:DNA repair protein XRCC4 n=1 Tax=Aspergillus lucknowensis TaxID=176173 RepID=A0ABR4LFY6_9EURO